MKQLQILGYVWKTIVINYYIFLKFWLWLQKHSKNMKVR